MQFVSAKSEGCKLNGCEMRGKPEGAYRQITVRFPPQEGLDHLGDVTATVWVCKAHWALCDEMHAGLSVGIGPAPGSKSRDLRSIRDVELIPQLKVVPHNGHA